jgi:hypothetical protein
MGNNPQRTRRPKKEGQHGGWPWEAFLLSHIKAPAQGGKAGSGKPPTANLTKIEGRFKVEFRGKYGTGGGKSAVVYAIGFQRYKSEPNIICRIRDMSSKSFTQTLLL